MANVTNYEYLRKLMSTTGQTSIDGTILNVAGKLADVRLGGSSRVLEDVQIAEHIQASAGQTCSLGIHGGEAFVLAVFQNIADDSVGYVPRIAVMQVPAISVRTARDGYVCSWTYSGPAHHFELYANDSPEGGSPYLVGSFAGNTYTVPYSIGCPYFAVRAVALDGTEGPLSVWATDAIPVAASTDLTHAFQLAGHALAWNYVTLDDVRSFEVYRNTSAVLDENAVLVGTSPATNPGLYTVPYAAGGDYFGVRAVGWDDTVSDTIWVGPYSPAPGVPENVEGWGSIAGAQLSWSAPAGSSVLEYVVYSDDNADGTSPTERWRGSALQSAPIADNGDAWFWVAAVGYDGSVSSLAGAGIIVAGEDEVSVEDQFDGYGNREWSDLETLYWYLLSGFDDNWEALVGTISDEVTTLIEGATAKRNTTLGAPYVNYGEIRLMKALDLSKQQRFGPDDFLTVDLYLSQAMNDPSDVCITTFKDALDNWAVMPLGPDGEWLAGWNHCRVKRSTMEIGPVEPDWAGIQKVYGQFMPSTDAAMYAIWDNLRMSKADPDDPSVPNDTGSIWDFTGGVWYITPGARAGEPSKPCSLAQVKTVASPTEWYMAHHTRSSVKYGMGIAGMYLKDADGQAAFAFCIQDPTPETRTCYAAELDTAANLVRLVKWVNGVRTEIGSQGFTANPNQEVWVGVDWRGLDGAGYIKVYASTTEGNLIQANNLLFAKVDTGIARGGYVGVMALGCNVRFFYVRAGSPAHTYFAENAMLAERAKVADHATDADAATTATEADHATAADDAGTLGGASLSTDGTLGDNSDTLIPSQQAVKTYADGIAIRGDWTPVIRQGANAPALSVTYAHYLQIGKWVFIMALVQFSAAGAGSGTIYLEGFPGTPAHTGNWENVAGHALFTDASPAQFLWREFATYNATQIIIQSPGVSIASGDKLGIEGFYEVV